MDWQKERQLTTYHRKAFPMQTPIPLCDPHFHLWDLAERPNPNLGDVMPAYRADDYAQDMSELPPELRRVSGVHVETVVGQVPNGIPVDTLEETRWVRGQLEPSAAEQPFGIVAYVHLGRDNAAAERTIEQHLAAAKGRLCGVRMILNHHPDNPDLTWPQVEDGVLQSSSFREGLALLERHNLAFDLSCNPHQVAAAVAVFRDFPNLCVVTNHLGFLHDGEDQAHEELWREGMAALAALPNVYMKLSMAWFARDAFHEDAAKEAKIAAVVQELIERFGCNRCMFASNYPVDKLRGISIGYLYAKFLEWSTGFSNDERRALFHDSAISAYGPLSQ